MGLNKIRLGDIIVPFSQACCIPHLDPVQVSGVNRDKEFFEPSRQVGEDTSQYQIVPQRHFACNLMHVGRDKVLPIAYNHSDKNKIVSPAYTVFSIKKDSGLLDEYFFLMLKCKERDRYFWFHTDASVRDGMTWVDFCDVDIAVPSVEIQQKYIDIYNAAKKNQQCYERGLNDLKLVCDGFIDSLRSSLPLQRIGDFVEISSDTNSESVLCVSDVRGISTEKIFIDTKANMDGVSISSYKVVKPQEFAYVADTSRRGDKMAIALNTTTKSILISSIYTVFRVKPSAPILPEFLYLFFNRQEFDRYARFNSWGSARETFDYPEMEDVRIPIPTIDVQKSIVEIFTAYSKRHTINDILISQVNSLCPVLIKGSIDFGKHQLGTN